MLTNEEKTKLETEIKQLEQITREKDGNDEFAKAQLFIGVRYNTLGQKEKAIDVLQNIRREDNCEVYTNAQFNIGVAYNELGQKEKAIEIWKKIKSEDNLKIYVYTQVNLGIAYNELGQKEKAIEIWKKIQREDNIELYAKAQFSLGIIYKDLGQKEKAIEVFQNIQREDNLELYENAQLFIGVMYDELGQKEKAIKVFQNIQREDNPSNYTYAQLILSSIYDELGQKDKAILILKNIKAIDNAKNYAVASFCIGSIYNEKGDIEKAIQAFKTIKDDYIEIYAKAQYHLGIIYLKNLNLKEDPLSYFKKSFQAKNSFHTQLYINILEFCKKSDYKQLPNYIKFLECVKTIRNTLQVDLKKERHENKLAHYTNVIVVNELLNKSYLRLNNIYGMNDPTEGDVLFKYLYDKLNQNDEYSDIGYSPFITCFTMNHDSLNQFRLYGKSDGKEATGISLVVNQHFFSTLPDIEFSSIQMGGNLKNELSQDTENTKSLKAQPIYRCIYIDPESGYIKLAQRDKITFYREYSKDGKQPEEIDIEWNQYQQYIHDKEAEIKVQLKNLRTEIEHILEHDEQDKQEQLKLIELILLPLRYLVKHAAFEDEQECRMCYITSLDDPCVKMDFIP